jgi:CBS domain containing-hemolysin-like protein
MIDPVFGFLIVLTLIILDALLAASRSALVNSRLSQLIQMEQAGVSGAARAANIAADTTRYLTSIRLGLSLTRILTIGFVIVAFVPLVQSLPIELGYWSYFLILLLFGVLLGLIEFLVEAASQRSPEKVAASLSIFIEVMLRVLSPLGSLLLRAAGTIAGTNGGERHPLVTEEEIMTMVDAGEEGGEIEEEEKAMIYSILRLNDTLAREVMVPRIDALAFDENTSLREATDILLETGYSRAPVFRESVDNVFGLIYVKDLLSAWKENRQDGIVGQLAREPYFVPEAKKVDELLEEMQARHVHIAIVVDEYGGTAGLVTIEDIVEEIIGEIRDEYDFSEEARVQQVGTGEFIFSGGIDLDDVNQLTGSEIPKDTSETLGGFIYAKLGRVPVVGDTLNEGGLHMVVEQVVRRRIRRVKATRLVDRTSSATTEGSFSEDQIRKPEDA